MTSPNTTASNGCPVDFVIAGSAKAGTTALAVMLDQHPDVYMSDAKEPDYFVNGFGVNTGLVNHDGRAKLAGMDPDQFIDSAEKYHGLFEGAAEGQLRGDASPRYLIEPEVPARLLAHRSDVKVVVILRDPATVAFANFVHHVRDRHESIGVDNAEGFADEMRYCHPQLHPFANHLALPSYAQHLPAWVDALPAKQLHVMIYEEFVHDRRVALSQLFDFLGLRDDVEIDVERRVNISGLPRFRWLHTAVLGSVGAKRLVRPFIPTKLRRSARLRIETANSGKLPTLDPAVRAKLDRRYVSDVRYVESLLGRPMHAWRRTQPVEA